VSLYILYCGWSSESHAYLPNGASDRGLSKSCPDYRRSVGCPCWCCPRYRFPAGRPSTERPRPRRQAGFREGVVQKGADL